MKRSTSAADPWAVGVMSRTLILIAFVTAIAVPLGLVPIIPAVPFPSAEEGVEEAPALKIFSFNEPVPPTITVPLTNPTPTIPHVGIISGHLGNDSGAICPDGLQEVDVNKKIADLVVQNLLARGWRVELLEEFDERLQGYEADALLSIHADSCTFPGKSGFKVARAESKYDPWAEDELVRCLTVSYQEQTGLAFDANTITYDMKRYHVYNEIHADTPAAIIETGFMLDDRDLLTQHADLVAQGIAAGLICFVEGELAP
ncbi:MAG: N-acetylmuramoyl-L-alanine amidase [Chloroflexota bacterium]|nr:N-acetylmuramoyl-L-alanine amidase [Chloroflexota bacterium]